MNVFKDVCDTTGAHVNAKAEKEVNAGDCNTDTPEGFAKAICLGRGVINTVVMLGPIIGNISEKAIMLTLIWNNCNLSCLM